MQRLNSNPSHTRFPPKSIKTLYSFFSSSSNSGTKLFSFVNYLIVTLNFPKDQAFALAKRCPRVKSPEKPRSVIQFLKILGLSESQIRTSVQFNPQILVLDVDKNLKPKIDFFQQLGLVGSDLVEFISMSSVLLTVSLENKLMPGLEILKKVLADDSNNQELILILRKCCWLLCKDPKLLLLTNIEFLKSCGVVGSRLSLLLKQHPSIFIMGKSKLRETVVRAFDIGFRVESRMFAHGLYTISCVSKEVFERKFECSSGCGFSRDEFSEMFRKMPGLIKVSEENLKLGIGFFLNEIKLEKPALIHAPWLLMYGIEDRVIPRYRVLQVLKSKRLLDKEPCPVSLFSMSEKEFLHNFVARFSDDAEELLIAFKNIMTGSSTSPKKES